MRMQIQPKVEMDVMYGTPELKICGGIPNWTWRQAAMALPEAKAALGSHVQLLQFPKRCERSCVDTFNVIAVKHAAK